MTGNTPASPDFTEAIGRWIAGTPRHWPPAAVDAAERAIADTVGCLIAGANDEAVRRVAGGVAGWGGGGGATRVGRASGGDAPWAALVNGTAAHALDYDDVLDPAASHVSAVLVPALLALAEEIDADGAALVDAYIAGVEVQECLAEAVNMVHYTRGWHTTLTLGAPSAAAACARLLGLDAGSARNALSIATSLAAGFKRQFGTNTKPLHAGLAAKNGIVAARLAAGGVTADPRAFEGERGFEDLLVGPGGAGFGAALARLGGPPAVIAPGVWLKRYPCCASTHRAVDGYLALAREHRLRADEVVRVRTRVSEAAVRNLMYARPADEMQARFSMPYCIAAAACDGDLTLATFRRSAIGRADLGAFLPRVAMDSDPEQPADMPSTVRNWATTTIDTADGRALSVRVVDPKGYPDNPLTEPEIEAKFADCAAGQPPRVAASYRDWRRIARAASVRALAATLREVAIDPPA